MKPVEPIIVVDLFRPLLAKLLGLLGGLSQAKWQAPTVCSGWSVKDVALHLLGGDIGILSRKRDGYSPGGPVHNADELLTLVNTLNATWVDATRRISPRLLCEMLSHLGEELCLYFDQVDPFALGEPVSWSGPDPAPVWLDLAREYTEKWHHQQQIRDAVGAAPLYESRYFHPVLDAFVRALPFTLRDVAAPDGSIVRLTIRGESGGEWLAVRQTDGWSLFVDQEAIAVPIAAADIEQDLAWRLFTKGIDVETARTRATLIGDEAIALKVLGMVSVIA